MKGTSGKRRLSRDIENAPHSGNAVTGSSSSSNGIDSFLQRLNDDADLNKGNRPRHSRKASDMDTDGSSPPGSPKTNKKRQKKSRSSFASLMKRIIKILFLLVVLLLLYDTATSPPEKRLLGSHNRIHDFLLWIKDNPGTGAAAFVFVYGMFLVFLLPLGTPLTLGVGCVYKVAYGWSWGLAIATFTSMAGSLFGSVSCFVLGRYVMRDRVRKWGRKYPLFDAIDVAISDNGFKIMCLLYLTPILPLGPVSYLCGTTSMPLIKFASAKIAALPLMLLYVFIGASTDTFFGDITDGAGEGGEDPKVIKNIHGVDEETHRKMVLFGVCLSIVSISLVSHFVKKELYKIFDKQKREKAQKDDYHHAPMSGNLEEQVEIVGRKDNLLRRPRGHDEEKG
mmetsp:Transcript_16647/g.35147  ORF Transcript_16647/g.35147 Transcript_16647/m.35147 type:complete len:394 (-) Transcript_16647:155-1336(-)